MVARQWILAYLDAADCSVGFELAIVERDFDHNLSAASVACLSAPIFRVEVFNDLAVIVEQTAPHTALDRESLMEVSASDTDASRAADSGVELYAVHTLILEVREEGGENRFLALTFFKDFANQFKGIRVLYFGQVAETLAVLKRHDNLFEDGFLFGSKCHSVVLNLRI